MEHAHYSGKHRATGLLVLGLTDQAGNLLWVSAAAAARTAEITLARRHHIPARLRTHEDRLRSSFRRHATILIRALMILTNAHITR